MDFKIASIFIILLLMLIAQSGRAWDVDFSRRQKTAPEKMSDSVTTDNDTQVSQPGPDFVKTIHTKDVKDRQELVILNTQKGFVPSSVRLHKGLHYRVHVVNVNEDKKNVSFIMDEFNQHHATYFGQIKSFDLDPDKEGVFKYECPETTSIGKIVVFGPGKNLAPAQPLSEVERNVSSEP